MKQGKCPKCGSTDVYSGEDIVFKSGPFGSNSIPIGLTSIASLDNYVCSDCGLVESYISEKTKRKEIAKRWDRVKDKDKDKGDNKDNNKDDKKG